MGEDAKTVTKEAPPAAMEERHSDMTDLALGGETKNERGGSTKQNQASVKKKKKKAELGQCLSGHRITQIL